MKRKVCIIIAFCLIATIALATTAFARYSYISTLSAGLSISSSGTATATGSISPKESGLKTTVSVTLKKQNGSSWSTYGGAWSNSGTGYSGTSASGSKTLEAGTYKVVVVGKVYDANGNLLESDTVESPTRSFS